MTQFLLTLAAMTLATWHADSAYAHATPVEYAPAASATLEQAPTGLTIRFSERVEPRASFISISSNDDVAKPLTVIRAKDNPFLLEAPVNVGTGAHLVTWQVLSADDGHFTKGSYAFFVGSNTDSTITATQARFTLTHRSGLLEGTIIALELLGGALVFACLALAWLLGKPEGKGKGFMKACCRAGIALLFMGLAGSFVFQVVNFMTQTGQAFPDALSAVVSTSAGFSVLWRLASAAMLGIGVWRWEREKPFGKPILLIAIVLLAGLRASLSHAAASLVLPELSIAMNAVHLLAKDLWIGGVIVFVAAYLPSLAGTRSLKETAQTHLRVAKLFNLCLLIGGVTGCYIVWLHLKDFSNIRATHWGMHFVTLTTFAAVLLSCRLYHLFIVLPAAKRLGGKHTDEDLDTVSTAGITLSFEALTGLGVLLFSSILIITTPPLLAEQKLNASLQSGDTTVRLSNYNFDPSALLISFENPDASHPVDTVTVTVWKVANSRNYSEPIVVPTEKIFDGGYLLRTKYFLSDGSWAVTITGQRKNAYDAIASLPVTVPDDIAPGHGRFFGPFERSMLLTALAIIILWIIINTYLHGFRRHFEEDLTVTLRAARMPETMFSLAGGTVLLFFLGYSSQNHAHGRLQLQCIKDRNVWQESVPMRNGIITSEAAVLGCTIEGLQSHIGDAREYDALTGTSDIDRKIPMSDGE